MKKETFLQKCEKEKLLQLYHHIIPLLYKNMYLYSHARFIVNEPKGMLLDTVENV